MSLYTSLAATASRLLATKGQAVTLTRTADKTYDPTTGATAGTPATEVGRGALLNYSDAGRATASSDGSMAPKGRMKLVLATAGISKAPSIGDQVALLDETGTSKTWSILDCDTLAPAGVAVVYICQLGT